MKNLRKNLKINAYLVLLFSYFKNFNKLLDVDEEGHYLSFEME